MKKIKCCLCPRLSKAAYTGYLGTRICHECKKKLSKEEFVELRMQTREKYIDHKLNTVPYSERRIFG